MSREPASVMLMGQFTHRGKKIKIGKAVARSEDLPISAIFNGKTYPDVPFSSETHRSEHDVL
jgi:hypothetical protein